MALIEIQRVEVGPRTLTARVHMADGAPLMTSDDIEGTARVYYLLPHIVDHVCLGDVSEKFRDVMGDTEVAHLLEHVTVELLALTNLAGDVSSGRTFAVEGDDRAWDIELACPDDVLVSAALASAVWLLDWAYTGGGEPEPDIEATVAGLVGLMDSLPEPQPQQVSEGEVLVDEFTPVQEDELVGVDAVYAEGAAEPVADGAEVEAAAEPVGETEVMDEAGAEPEVATDQQADVEPEVDGAPEAETDAEPEAESAPVPEAEPLPEPEPAPAPEGEPAIEEAPEPDDESAEEELGETLVTAPVAADAVETEAPAGEAPAEAPVTESAEPFEEDDGIPEPHVIR